MTENPNLFGKTQTTVGQLLPLTTNRFLAVVSHHYRLPSPDHLPMFLMPSDDNLFAAFMAFGLCKSRNIFSFSSSLKAFRHTLKFFFLGFMTGSFDLVSKDPVINPEKRFKFTILLNNPMSHSTIRRKIN